MKKLMLFAFIIGILSCSDSERTKQILAEQGYTNIETRGHAYSKCSDDDTYCTEFTATNPAGHRVHGAVGCGDKAGCSKGCTIRFD